MMIPALLHMMSSRPGPDSTSRTRRATSAETLTSAWAASARPPADWMSLAVSSAVVAEMSAATTVAPAAAKTWAMPRPMPLPAPVTMAVRPVRSVRLVSLGESLMRKMLLSGETSSVVAIE